MLETRFIDGLGRIKIPIKVTRKLNYMPKTSTNAQKLEITLEYGKICLRKFEEKDIEKRSNVGIVRSVDDCSRVVIPPEFRTILNIDKYTELNGEVDYETQTIRFWKAA